MTPQEQLKLMSSQIATHIAGDEILFELECLLVAFEGVEGNVVGYKLAVQDAIEHAEMLFSLRDTTHQPDALRDILISYIDNAAEIAGELQR